MNRTLNTSIWVKSWWLCFICWKISPACGTGGIVLWASAMDYNDMYHNEHNGVSNHLPHNCLLNCLFRRRSKKTSKLRITGLCEGNSPVTSEFPAQKASNVENVSISWCHHGIFCRLVSAGRHLMRTLIYTCVSFIPPDVSYNIIAALYCIYILYIIINTLPVTMNTMMSGVVITITGPVNKVLHTALQWLNPNRN